MVYALLAALLWSVALGFGFVAGGVFYVAYRVLRSDRQAYQANRGFFGDGPIIALWLKSFRGKASARDGDEDFHRVHRGVAINLSTGELEAQSRPSGKMIDWCAGR